MSEVMECTSCGFKNWQTTCWSCNAVLPVTKQVEELKAENERLREAMNCCEAIAFDFSDDEIKSEAPSVRGAWKIGNESLRNQGPAEGADDE